MTILQPNEALRALALLVIMLSVPVSYHALADEAARQAPLSPNALERLDAQAASLDRLHAVMVAENGEIRFEHAYGGPGLHRPANIKSLSKTVLAALVGAPIEDGTFDSPDQTVAELLGSRVPAGVDPRVREITVGHLLSLQAGLERTSGGTFQRELNALVAALLGEDG